MINCASQWQRLRQTEVNLTQELTTYEVEEEGKYYINPPHDKYTGPIYVPRVDRNNEVVGHDLLTYKDGALDTSKSVVNTKDEHGTSLLSARFMKEFNKQSAKEQGRKIAEGLRTNVDSSSRPIPPVRNISRGSSRGMGETSV